LTDNKYLVTPPLWLSVETLQNIIEETSGERARYHFRHLNLMGGYAPSPQIHQIAEYIRGKGDSCGLKDMRLEGFPSDGELFYGAFLTEPSWDARNGSLWQISPRKRLMTDFSVTPCSLGRYSRSTEVEAELIYVGTGTASTDYEGKDVSGKIVLASGAMGKVHAEAVYRHGALGVVTYRTRDRFDRPDLVSGGQLTPWRGPKGNRPTFGFGVSYRQGQSLLADLERGSVRVRVKVDADLSTGEYPEVTGVIPGAERPDEEVLLTAHIDHRNTGGNNSTGVSVTLEVVRVLTRLIADGVIPRPRRTIRFIWGPEHKGFVAYLHHHPEALKSWLYVLNIDMAGKSQSKFGSRFHFYRSPHSNPTVVDDAIQEVLEWAVAGNRHTKLSRSILAGAGTPYIWPILDPLGSRDDFLATVDPFSGPSDHLDLNDGSLGVHSAYLNDFPDPFIGVHQDNPETVDPTQMKRAVVVAAVSLLAIANAGPRESEQLASIAVSHAYERLAIELRKGIYKLANAGKDELEREALEAHIAMKYSIQRELRSLDAISPWLEGNEKSVAFIEELKRRLESEGEHLLQSLAHYHDSTAKAKNIEAVVADRNPKEKAMIGRIPVRTARPRGPVDFSRYIYGTAWLAEQLGNWDFLNLDIRRDGNFVPYELLNFVNGTRDLLEIRDSVSSEFGPIPADHVVEYFDVLEKVGVVIFKE